MQESGTFRKALWRRLYANTVPILSEIVAYTDRDGNLELANDRSEWVSELWLAMFKDESFTELHYDSFISTFDESGAIRRKAPILKSGCNSHVFQCHFPFSWLVKEKVDSVCREAKSIAGIFIQQGLIWHMIFGDFRFVLCCVVLCCVVLFCDVLCCFVSFLFFPHETQLSRAIRKSGFSLVI